MTQDDPLVAPRVINRGRVYTPEVLADWVADELLHHLPRTARPLIVDPACGDGALLRAVRRHAGRPVRLIGCDIDELAAVSAAASLRKSAKVLCADALRPVTGMDPIQGWNRVLRGAPVDALIANPPWGAELDIPAPTLRKLGFGLAFGQFDTYDLFLELSLKLLAPQGIAALILPDSLFLPEHEATRRLLVAGSQILTIARLGEGFFSGVFRAAVVVVFRKAAPNESEAVKCIRLSKDWRGHVLRREVTFNEAVLALQHHVPQSRFSSDNATRFDVDASAKDAARIHRFDSRSGAWNRWVDAGRGVEISKNGDVLLCPKCGLARPRPAKPVRCAACGTDVMLSPKHLQKIIAPISSKATGWWPLIVGEDVTRYRARPTRAIALDIPGINYKSESQFSVRKLLIRKTGVGLHASIDETGAYTNQVVFHYTLKPDAPPFFLDYLLGVLCSRVLLAYHLKRSGELEWRSHPYITQKVIATLPVVVPIEGTSEWSIARQIAALAKERLEQPSRETELKIDRHCASLFRLTASDCEWVRQTLESAQSLRAIKEARFRPDERLEPSLD